MEIKEQEDVLRKFLTELDCLDEIERCLERVDVFDVLGVARTEIRHSRMLAWLLDPNGSHGVGVTFLRVFLQRLCKAAGGDAFQLLTADLDTFVVHREYKSIDLLLESKEAGVVIAIENKVDASEHDDQLRRYRETVRADFPGDKYYQLFVFLSPDARPPTDEAWQAIGYDAVVAALDVVLAQGTLVGAAAMLVGQYRKLLEREFMNKDQLTEICNRIYREHRQALDLIFELKVDSCSQVFETIMDWFKNHPQTFLRLDAERSCKSYVRFTTEFLLSVVPPLADGRKGGWNSDKCAYYEICNQVGKVSLKLSMSSQNVSPAAAESAGQAFAKYDFKPGWTWCTLHNFSKKLSLSYQEPDAVEAADVNAFMDRIEQQVSIFEAQAKARLGNVEK